MRKKYKIWLRIISLIFLIVCGLGILKLFVEPKKEKKLENVTNIISSIDNFGYTLDDRDTKYMKDEFKILEDILNKKELDYELYAKSIAKLFVIDFYTLNNKVNKYDIGSLEYILSDKKDMFRQKAMDTIYNDIIDNTYKDRIQDLPEITNVEILSLEESKIKLEKIETDCYKVTLKYTYRENLGYDDEGTIYLVKNNEKLEVALYEPEIKEEN